jgi:hypothetical protein
MKWYQHMQFGGHSEIGVGFASSVWFSLPRTQHTYLSLTQYWPESLIFV